MSGHSGQRYKRVDQVVARRVAGELLLVPVAGRSLDTSTRAAELFVLNETGERLWDWLSVPTSVEELARNLMREYEISIEEAIADAEGFIVSLRAIRMVDEVGD